MTTQIIKRKSPNLTKREIGFLLTASDNIDDKFLRARIRVRILSRIAALGLCGGWRKDKKLNKTL